MGVRNSRSNRLDLKAIKRQTRTKNNFTFGLGEVSETENSLKYSGRAESLAPHKNSLTCQGPIVFVDGAAECAVCCDPLYVDRACFFIEDDKRICRHFFHEKCGRAVKRTNFDVACPTCRLPFERIEIIPDFTREPGQWLYWADMNNNKLYSKQELSEMLSAVMPLEVEQLEKDLERFFGSWDTEGTGLVTKEQILDPTSGFLEYVKKHIKVHPPSMNQWRKSLTLGSDFSRTAKQWFRLCDHDGDGALTYGEVLRGFIDTFDNLEIEHLGQLLTAVWHEFDGDRDGKITMREFVGCNGLAETVLANIDRSGT